MNSPTAPPVTTAFVDSDLKLIEADRLLATLQLECGGRIGSTLAIPELLLLVRKSAKLGLRLARPFNAHTGEKLVSAWAEISPHTTGEGTIEGCELAITGWRTEEGLEATERGTSERRVELSRHLAECTARLDPQLRVLSLEAVASDLADLVEVTREKPGSLLTELIRTSDSGLQRSVHWRILNGATGKIDGSARSWQIELEPLGQDADGPKAGFALYLSADQPLVESVNEDTHDLDTPSFGRDLTPVLRQPINRIIANAETIRTKLAGPLADDYSNYAADIATAAQHLLALIDDLSDLEVVESDEFTTAPDRIELADVARRACGILGVRAQEKGITLVPPVDGESQLAIAEFRRVLQILLNLVGNAIRYSPKDSQVWVRLDRVGNRALITVADQGHGLDADQQGKVFEKFERLGRSGDGGSGLGLYISRRIARAMDGDLTIDSAPGQGARFTLSIPAADELRTEPRDHFSTDRDDADL